MKYDKDEFFDLMERVDADGGEHLDAQCQAREFTFSGDKMRPVLLPGCGESALFHVPYEGIKGAKDNGPVQVCAVDDDMGRWPRFGGDRFGRDEDDA